VIPIYDGKVVNAEWSALNFVKWSGEARASTAVCDGTWRLIRLSTRGVNSGGE